MTGCLSHLGYVKNLCSHRRLLVILGEPPRITFVSQIMLLLSTSLFSWIIALGYGKHIQAIDPSTLPMMGLLGYTLGSAAVFAIVWSKTSFAITLLRLVQGRLKFFVWFIIISMNIFMTMSIINLWISCRPVERVYNPSVPGVCWPKNVVVDYATFSAGKFALMCPLSAGI